MVEVMEEHLGYVTIASWNVSISNPDIHEALNFINASHWDILCLQEVPPELAELIRIGPWKSCGAQEAVRLKGDGSRVVASSIILVRNSIILWTEGRRFAEILPLKMRTKFLILVMKLLKKYDGKSIRKGFIWADVIILGRMFRVFSVHLKWANPSQRDPEWDSIVSQFSTLNPNIVCGDMNVFHTGKAPLMNWFLGEKFQNCFPPERERDRRNRDFATVGLRNAVADLVTHKSILGDQQLDYILIPKDSLTIKGAVVEPFDPKTKQSHGSDHALVTVVAQINQLVTQ